MGGIMDGRWPLSPAEQEELRRSTEPKTNGPTVIAVAVVSAVLTLVAMMALRVGILAIMNVWRNIRRRTYAEGLRRNQGINQSTLTFDKERKQKWYILYCIKASPILKWMHQFVITRFIFFLSVYLR